MKKKILLVDDDDACRAVCREELAEDGYAVCDCAQAPEALERLERENFDLVILDIRMPRMDGIETLGRILSRRPGLPVVFYTAFESYRDNFLSWGADAYIIKSPDIGPLKAKVGELLG